MQWAILRKSTEYSSHTYNDNTTHKHLLIELRCTVACELYARGIYRISNKMFTGPCHVRLNLSMRSQPINECLNSIYIYARGPDERLLFSP